MKQNIIILLLLLSIPISLFGGEFLISGGAFSHTYPVVSFGHENYQVTWVDKRTGSYNYGFWGRMIDSNGNLVGEENEIVGSYSNLSFMPDIETDGTNYLFAWTRYRSSSGPGDVYGILISQTGTPIGTKFRISLGNTINASFPNIAWDGTNYLVVWQLGFPSQDPIIQGQFISSTGLLVGNNFTIRPSSIPSTANQIYPAVAFSGTNYLVVWDDDRIDGDDRNIYGQFVGTDGSLIGDGFSISVETNDQMLVDLAFSGTNFLAVWKDGRYDVYDESIFGQLISPDGTLIGGNFAIGDTSVDEENSWPSVASSGNSFLVSWDQAITVKDETQPSFSKRLMMQQAGVEYTRPTIWWDVYAQKVSLTGDLIDNNIPICTEVYHQSDSYIASDGDDYLVVWDDSRNGNQYSVIYGSIVADSIQVSITEEVNNNSIDIFAEPNPATTELSIKYNLTKQENVELNIYNIKGEKIRTINNGFQNVGFNQIHWNLKDDNNNIVPNGVYLYQVKTRDYIKTSKIVVIR